MKILARTGNNRIATVYIGQTEKGNFVEFVESIAPPLTKKDKWVLIVSTLSGCPISCKFCDSGFMYEGKLSAEEILEQVDFLVKSSYPNGKVETKKFKIQFARMGDPALNSEVIEVLETLYERKYNPNLVPSVSTVAPKAKSTDNFFERLKNVKDKFYKGNFQLQFSIHSTDKAQRDWLIPVKKWSFEQIAEYGKYFYSGGDMKIALNFAVNPDTIIEPEVIIKHFSPEVFLIKITPINPTVNTARNRVDTALIPEKQDLPFINVLESFGYRVLISIGELEENKIGSNCGQLLMQYLKSKEKFANCYSYEIQFLE
ncbi:MAG: radical SAM protein [Ignavibacteria bacterium]|nr:radical SAM protein [Ignavibacteria bacterium]